MGVFENEMYLNPKYNFLEKYVKVAYKGFWTPAKYEHDIQRIDVPEFNNELSDVEQETIRKCILAVSLVEDKVKTFWNTISLDFPQTIIGDIGGLLGQMEVTHRRSYHSLTDGLNIDVSKLDQYEALQGRIKYLTKYLEKDPKIIGKKRILKKLILFTTLVEKCSLFTQFYILMSFQKRKQSLKSIAKLQRSTAIEENVHYSFGIDLINIIKSEYPQLWTEHLIELVEKNLKDAYDAEVKLIDWFFEKGTPDHITKEEVINILNYNFKQVCDNLKLNLNYEYDEQLFMEKNIWFTESTKAPVSPDFFDGNIGGYSDEKEDINVETFTF